MSAMSVEQDHAQALTKACASCSAAVGVECAEHCHASDYARWVGAMVTLEAF